MKIIVAGSRCYSNYDESKAFIDRCISENCKEECVILSGGCNGADMIGERYAHEHGYPIIRYPAEWDKYGKKAGPIRNIKMAENCDIIICFWDGKSKGTQSLILHASKKGIPVFIKYINSNI